MYIGLTGSIGSGKTTVAELFYKHYKIAVISADECSKEVMKEPFIIEAIVKYFGNIVLNSKQKVNRQYLREVIFRDFNARNWLEKLMHPIIQNKIYFKIEEKKRCSNYIIIEIPLLNKKSLRYHFYLKKIITVVTALQLKINRIMARDHSSIEQVHSILNAQINDQERITFSNYVIYNNSSKIALKKQVKIIHESIVSYTGVDS